MALDGFVYLSYNSWGDRLIFIELMLYIWKHLNSLILFYKYETSVSRRLNTLWIKLKIRTRLSCMWGLTYLGIFWLKIEQFWPFEEISIFSHGGHLGYRTALTDKIFKGDHPRFISAKFGWDWHSSFRGEDFF